MLSPMSAWKRTVILVYLTLPMANTKKPGRENLVRVIKLRQWGIRLHQIPTVEQDFQAVTVDAELHLWRLLPSFQGPTAYFLCGKGRGIRRTSCRRALRSTATKSCEAGLDCRALGNASSYSEGSVLQLAWHSYCVRRFDLSCAHVALPGSIPLLLLSLDSSDRAKGNMPNHISQVSYVLVQEGG